VTARAQIRLAALSKTFFASDSGLPKVLISAPPGVGYGGERPFVPFIAWRGVPKADPAPFGAG
jgi:hypothetical protein